METITITEYAKKVGYNGDNPTIEKIQDFAENEMDLSLWDYPLSELDYLIQEKRTNFVAVQLDNEIRLCEYE